MLNLYSFFSGLIFGFGLLISGMANPSRVLGFLDVAGKWDPSLGFVMIGAILISFLAFQYSKRMKKTLCGEEMKLPCSNEINKKLIFGSLIFGIGWGLVGFCPGPVFVALGAGKLKALIFIIAMLMGMLIYEGLQKLPFFKS